jgi:hypothetical protein
MQDYVLRLNVSMYYIFGVALLQDVQYLNEYPFELVEPK